MPLWAFQRLKQNLKQHNYWKRVSFYKAIGEREEGREWTKEEEDEEEEEEEDEEEEEEEEDEEEEEEEEDEDEEEDEEEEDDDDEEEKCSLQVLQHEKRSIDFRRTNLVDYGWIKVSNWIQQV